MKKYIVAILIICLCLTVISCSNTTKTEDKAEQSIDEKVILTEQQQKNAGIITDSIRMGSRSSSIKLTGKIDVPPQNMISVSAPLGGYLKHTDLLPGMHINKGQVIALMEDQQYINLQQDYLITKNETLLAEQEANRQQTLFNNKAGSEKIYQQAKSNYINLKIKLRALEEKLKLIGMNPEKITENNITRVIQIHSSIDGFVSHVNVNIGKYVQPAEVMFELVNPTDIHLALHVFEKDLNQLYIGQKLMVYTNRNPEKKYECEIILIGKDVSDDRSVMVHCHFNSYDKVLIPGMFLNAELNINEGKSWYIPESAVVHYEGKDYIFIEEKRGSYKPIEITFLSQNKGNVYFESSSIQKGNTVVINGAYSLLMSLNNKEE
ncbi:MAG: efflux RND transporter periplasmic adaptor subunit [Bacteroidia bacterium]|jgi:cobalt-zinc-cadmium efflux system membrane fusion protein|nr:efflux RND transporter periplasmic adaptor subunit [Bacteroidia bacterium]